LQAVLSFIVTLLLSSIIIWLSQKLLLPRDKEKGFLSVLALAFIWSIIESILYLIFSFTPLGPLEKLITLLLWIWVLKSWFGVGWLRAAIISLIAWFITILVKLFLGLLALSALTPREGLMRSLKPFLP